MSQIYTTGPVNIFVGANPAGTPLFLGWSGGKGARVKKNRFTQNVHTDLSGPNMPHDKSYLGEVHSINFRLGRWNEAVLRRIQDVPGARSLVNRRGAMYPGDMGALLATQGCAWPLWLEFQYRNVPAFADGLNAMGGGYHYALAHLTNEDDEGGVTPRGIQLSIETIPYFDITAVSNGIRGGWVLYDEDMSAVNGFNID